MTAEEITELVNKIVEEKLKTLSVYVRKVSSGYGQSEYMTISLLLDGEVICEAYV